jgi:hypothetical protein
MVPLPPPPPSVAAGARSKCGAEFRTHALRMQSADRAESSSTSLKSSLQLTNLAFQPIIRKPRLQIHVL